MNNEIIRKVGALRANPAVFIGVGSILLRPFFEASRLVAKADFVESPNANDLPGLLHIDNDLAFNFTILD